MSTSPNRLEKAIKAMYTYICMCECLYINTEKYKDRAREGRRETRLNNW